MYITRNTIMTVRRDSMVVMSVCCDSHEQLLLTQQLRSVATNCHEQPSIIFLVLDCYYCTVAVHIQRANASLCSYGEPVKSLS